MRSSDCYYLFSGENREVCGVVVRQPRVWELLKYEIDVEGIIEPFMAFVDLCDMSDEMRSEYRNLDLVFHDHVLCERDKCVQDSKLKSLVTALIYLCNTNNVAYNMATETISVNGIDRVNRDNFDRMQEYILSMFHVSKPTDKDKIKIRAKSDKQRERVLRMKKMLDSKKKKSDMSLANIIKVVKNGDGLSYETILDMTYWKLIDRYVDIMKMDSYKTYMDYKLSPKYEIKEERKTHWTEDIKV